MKKKILFVVTGSLSAVFFQGQLVRLPGHSLIVDNPSATADVAIVLTTGVDYLPRLLQAAQLYRDNRVKKVLINGNRKTDAIRELEKQGFIPACKWSENSLQNPGNVWCTTPAGMGGQCRKCLRHC